MISFLYHEIRYSFRTSGGPGAALGFFALGLILFPILVGPEQDILRRIGPGMVWLMAGLASLIYAPHLIQEDMEDGSLHQILLLPTTPIFLFIYKTIAHFLLVGIPVLGMSVLATVLYALPMEQASILALSLVIGIPALSSLSIFGSTLCSGAQGGSLLIMLIILPIMTPLFIFGLSMVDAASLGLSVSSHLYLLGASSLGLIVMSVTGGQYGLRPRGF